MKRKMITRRDFLRVTAGTAVAATLGPAVPGETRAEQTAKVVLVRNAAVLNREEIIQEDVLQSMLDEAVKSLFGVNDPLEAWR